MAREMANRTRISSSNRWYNGCSCFAGKIIAIDQKAASAQSRRSYVADTPPVRTPETSRKFLASPPKLFSFSTMSASITVPLIRRAVTPMRVGFLRQYHISPGAGLRSSQKAFVPRFRPPRQLRPRRPYSNESKPAQATETSSPTESAEDPRLPVTQRLKILFKKYRWPALGIYLGLSFVDFGVAFLAVRAFGTERIGRYERIIIKKVEDTFGYKTKGTAPEYMEGGPEVASIWTEIALAYTIHKTLFALIRVPVTVAITPPLVKWYQRKGYGAVLARLPMIGGIFKPSPAAAQVARKG
jgi:N-terminal acetyltransferase 2